MPPPQIPQITVPNRRARGPAEFGDAQAYLETLHQPLYSAFDFNTGTAPTTAALFGYAVGQQLAGAVAGTNATLLHTNMQQQGTLPAPKLFLITGIRIVPVELDSGLTDPLDNTAGASNAAQTYTGQDSNLLEDLLRLVYGSYLDLFIGNKSYLQVPTWFCPGNTGIDGVAAAFGIVGASATNLSETQRFLTHHSAGKYFALAQYPIVLPNQQVFSLSLNFPQTSRPAFGARRLVYGVLDGLLGREVQ